MHPIFLKRLLPFRSRELRSRELRSPLAFPNAVDSIFFKRLLRRLALFNCLLLVRSKALLTLEFWFCSVCLLAVFYQSVCLSVLLVPVPSVLVICLYRGWLFVFLSVCLSVFKCLQPRPQGLLGVRNGGERKP